MVDPVKPRRTYRSAVRERSARRTRRDVVAAAARLFVERGYAATSLADIAEVAEVARPTVFAAFGSKPALLRQVLDQALAGDDEPVPVAQRDWFAPVWGATSPDGALRAYAEVCVLIGGRAAELFEVVRRAADESAELAGLWGSLVDNRRTGAAGVIDHTRRLGPLRSDLTVDRAVDVLWLLNDPALYASLVLRQGWPVDDFGAWLARSMRSALLPG